MSASRSEKVFNKFFSGFLRDIKEIHEDLRAAVKASYQVVDKGSDAYCSFFKEHVMPVKKQVLAKDFSDEVLAKHVCQNITLGDVFAKCSDDDKNMVLNYVFIMMLFAYISEINEDQDVVLGQAVQLLSFIQKKDYESYKTERENVVDDDLAAILDTIQLYGGNTRVDADKASAESSTEGSSSSGDFDPMGFFGKLNNSKIADLAKEISQDIDVSSLKAENPDDLLKNLFNTQSDGSGNVLGNIIQKVSNTLNNKISKGELSHEDLLGEAMSMMNMFGGKGGAGGDPFANLASNPLFSQVAKAMKGGKANLRQDVIKKASARDRLKKKLEDRRQSSSNA